MITRLPFAIHITAASCTCGGEILLSPSLRVRHTSSGFGRSSALILRCDSSIRRLGLGGPALVTAENVRCVVLGGRLGGGFMDVEPPFFRSSIALVSE